MKKLLIIFTIIAWLPLAHANDAELNKAQQAYESGDYETARSILQSLAKKGNVVSQYNLGLMYEKGEGISQNYEKAVKWFRKAAEQGLAEAQYNLGVMLAKGEGVSQNYEEAVKWYLKAAKQELIESQINLAILYATGRGIPKNYIQAYMWGSLVQANGNDEGEDITKLIEGNMTTADISKAQQLAKQCWESSYQNCGE